MSALVPTQDGRLQVEVDGVSIGVQGVVDGELLDPAEPKQVHAAGATLADLHLALADYPGAAHIRSVPGLTHPQAREDRLPIQLVHNDFRSANLLWNAGRITAVLDFEKVVHAHRVTDLAKTAVLLGTRYHDWGPIDRGTRETFLAGYRETHPLSPEE